MDEQEEVRVVERNGSKQESRENGMYFKLSEDYFTAFTRKCKKIESRKNGSWIPDYV